MARTVAHGAGWTVDDLLCSAGPRDRSFEERHTMARIALVTAGTFQYRSASAGGRASELMTPGSLLLGSMDRCFECGHDHAAGDRCLSFGYTPEFFERIAADAGARQLEFPALRLPPIRDLSPLVAHASAAASSGASVAWEEIAIKLAARAIQLAGGFQASESVPPSAEARVTRAVRAIERAGNREVTLTSLADVAGLSPYHFLRTFERLTGLTPHQYVLRARLRAAAQRLRVEPSKILDIALDCGFSDISNFNRAFRAEFGAAPRAFRSAGQALR